MHDWEYFLPYFRDVSFLTPRTIIDALDINAEARFSAPPEIMSAVNSARSQKELIARIDEILAEHILTVAGSFGEYGYYLIQVGPGQYSVRDFYPERRKMDAAEVNDKIITHLQRKIEELLKVIEVLSDKSITTSSSNLDGNYLASNETV